ncbi:MAG TPA: universal stress protein [Actinomycetota bacterium]
MSEFKRILLAVDGSEPSNRAVALTADLAEQTEAEVLVVHVYEREPAKFGAFPLETGEDAGEILDDAVRILKDRGISARGELRTGIFGRAARIILEEANDFDAGLVVLGSRGLSDLAGLVLGSVTHKVLHVTHCPVLVVR